MQPDTTKIWTRAEIRVNVGKILVESLGVDEATVTDQAALVRDLGAESIDFLDISFKCQQTFGVDLPARLIQDRLIEWRDLAVLAKVVDARYGVTVAPETGASRRRRRDPNSASPPWPRIGRCGREAASHDPR